MLLTLSPSLLFSIPELKVSLSVVEKTLSGYETARNPAGRADVNDCEDFDSDHELPLMANA